MPRGPNGERRPADAIGCAVMVGRIATGDMEDDMPMDRMRGVAGAIARVGNTTTTQRRAIAEKAAAARWGR